MIENGVEIVDAQSVRGKRGDLIGKITNQGIVWTNVKTGEQQLEHYDLEEIQCPFCGEQAAFYVTDYNRIRVKYTFCRCGYRNVEHEIRKRRSIKW